MGNQKIKVYSENVFSKLLKLLGGGKFRRELRKIEKMTEDDPSLQATLDSLAHQNKELERKLKNFCKRNPDHGWCNGKGIGGKSRITDIEK